MEEIEVGEYVRTKRGKIFQYGKGRAYLGKDNEIVKHSKNIIDLLQEGDFANEYKIIWINYKDKWIMIQNINEFGENGKKVLLENEIETILTKELYQANCYTVERED